MIARPPFASTLKDAPVRQALSAIAQNAQPQQGGIAFLKNSLNGGEISPELSARLDQPRYGQGCLSLLNMIPLTGGGVTRRPGFRHVGSAGEESWIDTSGRLFPWIYSSAHAFMLLFMTREDGVTPTMVYWLDRDGKQPAHESGTTLPYKGRDIFDVCCCQVGKVVYMAHPGYKPGKLIVELSGAGTPAFTWEELEFWNHTPIPSIASLEICGAPNEAASERVYCVTAINDATGEESLPSQPMDITCSQLTSVFHCIVKINRVPGCSEYRVYKKKGGQFGFIGRMTKDIEEFHDEGFSPDVTDPPPDNQRYFTNANNYPAIVFTHQQRLGWASTNNDPLTIWMSQTSNFECLSYKTPPQDDDAIEATLASSQANRILWCVSDRTGLAIGTEGEEWFLTGMDGAATVTPSSISFQPQTRYGTAAGIDPVRAASSLLFVQRGGRLIRDLGYSFAADRYEARDITLLAHHLFRFATVADWCWQAAPSSILWIVLSTGKLIGVTYMPEQEVCAWHRHDTDGDFLSCATLQDSEGRSRLWTVIRRQTRQAGGGARIAHYIEMLGNVFEGYPGQWDKGATLAPPVFTDGQSGHAYQSRCVPCLPEASGPSGGTAMRIKKINAIKLRVINSAPIKARIHSQNAEATQAFTVPIQTATPNATGLSYVAAADWPCPLGAGFREGATLELICDGNGPATILAINLDCEIATQGGGQV